MWSIRVTDVYFFFYYYFQGIYEKISLGGKKHTGQKDCYIGIIRRVTDKLNIAFCRASSTRPFQNIHS